MGVLMTQVGRKTQYEKKSINEGRIVSFYFFWSSVFKNYSGTPPS
jgi:hypothetical protein